MASMEVILDQQNPSSLDFVSSPSQTGQRASEGDCSLHRLSLQLSVSLYLLPTSDRLSSNSTSTVAKSTDANSRSAARQRGRVNASLLFTSVILPRSSPLPHNLGCGFPVNFRFVNAISANIFGKADWGGLQRQQRELEFISHRKSTSQHKTSLPLVILLDQVVRGLQRL